MTVTPIEKINGIYVKRDDLFEVAGVRGGKARTCWHIAQGAKGLVTAGSRHSPQVAIVASIAEELGIPCHVHVPTGQNTPMIEWAMKHGAEVCRHKPGYNGVIIKRAKDDSTATGFRYVPFGMQCEEAVYQTASQVVDIPQDVRLIVMPVGSGMSLAGVLTGLKNQGYDIPVLGIVVGADPTKRLDRYAPLFWRNMVTLKKSKYDYSKPCSAKLGELKLDEIYESKCVEYLEEDHLFWVVGRRPL